MSFPLPSPRTVRWRPIEGVGLEHLTLAPVDDGIRISSVVIGDRGGRDYGVRYQIACDADWCVRSLDLSTTDGRSLALRSDGAGHWSDASGTALPAFDGCIDIDLAGSPFTNTLPIRRLALAKGEMAELTMVYIPFDTFEPTIDGQIYLSLEPGALYRYAAADRSFTADLPVDADGLVTDYPTLFARL